MEQSKRLSLAQQIAQLEDVAPVDFDPEDVQVTGTDPDPDPDPVVAADNGAGRAHYLDVGPSSLRKLHDSLSDPKYDGAKTSRKQMLGESSQSENGSASEDAESRSDASEADAETRTVDEIGINRKVDVPTTVEASTERPVSTEQNSVLSSSLRKTREEDRRKGKAISKQIALWGSLLDARIRLQKSVTAGNRLPSPLHFAANEEVHASLVKMLEEARLLSNEIFDFQECLLSANEFIRPPCKRRRSTGTDYSVVDLTAELREASRAASELECTYHPHLVRTLNKWSSKIQAVAPSVLLPSNRNVFSRTTQHIKSAPQLIDETLADHSKVLARTQIYRGKGSRLGISMSDESDSQTKEDPEMFDDTDFYHQLLRDIIDANGNELGRGDSWMAMQKERKAKKKVDTKASKGRKLRYEVHEKIQNFMVPVLTPGGWHEEQIDELFASLLGKGFESAMQEAGETVDATLQEGGTQGGFRVFG